MNNKAIKGCEQLGIFKRKVDIVCKP